MIRQSAKSHGAGRLLLKTCLSVGSAVILVACNRLACYPMERQACEEQSYPKLGEVPERPVLPQVEENQKICEALAQEQKRAVEQALLVRNQKP